MEKKIETNLKKDKAVEVHRAVRHGGSHILDSQLTGGSAVVSLACRVTL
jgi:hypothetical protein